jgi:hypothetical protein
VQFRFWAWGVPAHDDYELGRGWQRNGLLSWLLFFLFPLIRHPLQSGAISWPFLFFFFLCLLFVFLVSCSVVNYLAYFLFYFRGLNVGRMFKG